MRNFLPRRRKKRVKNGQECNFGESIPLKNSFDNHFCQNAFVNRLRQLFPELSISFAYFPISSIQVNHSTIQLIPDKNFWRKKLCIFSLSLNENAIQNIYRAFYAMFSILRIVFTF